MLVTFCVYTILLRFLMQVFCVVTWIMCVWVLLLTWILICWRWIIVWITKSWSNLVVLYMYLFFKTLLFVLVLHMELVVFGKLCYNVMCMWHVDILFCVSCCVGKFKIPLGIEPQKGLDLRVLRKKRKNNTRTRRRILPLSQRPPFSLFLFLLFFLFFKFFMLTCAPKNKTTSWVVSPSTSSKAWVLKHILAKGWLFMGFGGGCVVVVTKWMNNICNTNYNIAIIVIVAREQGGHAITKSFSSSSWVSLTTVG